MNEIIRYCTPFQTDAAALGTMGSQAFSDTFAHLYDPIRFGRFLDESYGAGGRMERDLADPAVRWQAAVSNDEPIGYAKLSLLPSNAPAPEPGAMELRQIDVLSPWHGKGVAERLMRWAIDTAVAQGAPEIYLTVFDHNARAKRFYARHGFAEVAHCEFKLVDRVDDDLVWRKSLRGGPPRDETS